MVEGVGAGAHRVARTCGCWSGSSWHETRKHRALERDGDGLRPHWAGWAAQERSMLARERTPERADIVLDTSAPGAYRAVPVSTP